MLDFIKKIIKLIYFSIKKIGLINENVIIDSNVSFLRTNFTNFNRINKNTNIDRSIIGAFTYIGNDCYLFNVMIGAFSSIGPNVEVIYGTHPTNHVSSSPVFYSTRRQCGTTFVKENLFLEFNRIPDTNLSVIIGNDVWIGYGTKIIEGVTIGDGAIVLAGAYVTKDVEPYSIVGGVPARHLKYRFNEDQRALLLQFKWWDKDINWIKSNALNFLDIEGFISIIKEIHTS